MNDANKRTISIQGTFGLQEVTKDQFVQRWVNHTTQLYTLCTSTRTIEEVHEIKERVITLAEMRFEDVYTEQQMETP